MIKRVFGALIWVKPPMAESHIGNTIGTPFTSIWNAVRVTLTGVNMIKRSILSLCLVALALASAPACAQSAADLFKDADLTQGAQLMEQHRCTECHTRKVGGDGSAIYKPTGRINSPGFLRGMVEQCNTELNLGMFPDEVSSVAAVLNRKWYKFK